MLVDWSPRTYGIVNPCDRPLAMAPWGSVQDTAYVS